MVIKMMLWRAAMVILILWFGKFHMVHQSKLNHLQYNPSTKNTANSILANDSPIIPCA